MTDEEQQMLKEVEELIEKEQKLKLLLKVLKEYAEKEHCYNYERNKFYDVYDAFDDGADWGEITFARTLLEQIGVEFEYPVMKEQ